MSRTYSRREQSFAHRDLLRAVATVLVTLAGVGCASAGRLGEYDFRDRPVAVVTIAPPHPDVFTEGEFWLGRRSLAEAIVRVAGEIIREGEAEHARARLDSAVIQVNVAERMSARVLEQGARRSFR